MAGTSAMAVKGDTFGKSDMSSMSCVDDAVGSSVMTSDGFRLLGQMVEGSSSVGTSVVGTTSALTFNREDIKEAMIQMLIDDFRELGVTTICLIGSSGLGKTTLVYGVYNDPRVSEHFDTRIRVYMSESFNEECLMKEIIESVTHLSCGLTQFSLLQEVVKEELMGKKFLLILDDAENESYAFWRDLVTILSIGAKGSSIVVNTTNKAVGESIGTNHFYSLDPLSEETCWSIFQNRVFNGLDPITDPGLVRKCKELVTKCRGNPFYVKALGGLIYYAIKENQIGNILEHILWNEPEGKVSRVLAICYSFMPVHLKQCFVYFSLFPKKYVFAKLDIVRLWMSQGFIENIEGMQAEDTGLRYLDELFQRSFLQHPDFVEAQEDNFVMHELMYEMAQHYSISSKAFFRSEVSFLGLPQTVMHLSIVPSGFQMVQLKDTNKGLDNLRSFLVVSKSSVQKNMIIPHLVNLVDLDHLFVISKNIRTLVLSNTDIEELPSSIGLLEQLHYLELNNTKIRSLPSVICSIKTLQTLELKDCNRLNELPQNMKELINLRYLDTRKLSGNNVSMPNGLGQLINLKVLTTFNVGVDSLHCTISELKNLQNLTCLHITGIENAKNENDAKEADLKSKIHLKILELGWCENGNYEDVSIAEIVLHNLEPNRNLQELILKNYTGMQFPIWIIDPSFSKLISITLDNCYNCEKFPNLGEYPSLKCLSVRRMHGIQRMWDSGCNLGKENVKNFPSLNVLNLCEMYALEDLFELHDGDFPCLHTISISNCPMLKAIPRFPFLVELSIKCCVQVPHISELPSLEYLKIEEFHNIKSLGLPQILPVLKRLEIRRCNKLSSVEGLSQLTSLEKLKLFKCPNLDSLNNWQPYHEENVCRVKRCKIDGCSDSTKGSNDFCKAHGEGKRCKAPNCSMSASGGADFCISHGGGKWCEAPNCSKAARGLTSFCRAHGRRRRCSRLGCTKSAEGKTIFCRGHGGGKQCQNLGYTKSAEGKMDFCISHDGGRQCGFEGCKKAARGKSGLCIRHGGGKQCKVDGCTWSAEDQSGHCILHGGGRRCNYPDCTKATEGSTNFCKAHGGGKRCRWGQVSELGLPACDSFALREPWLCDVHAWLYDIHAALVEDIKVNVELSVGMNDMAGKVGTFGKWYDG